MSILLVEDDDMLGEAIVEGLQPRFRVDWARNLEAARASLATGQYRMMILDLGLPDGSGLDLLAGLRRNDNALPVLILSARDALPDRLAGLNRGADDYLVKPFDLDELLARCEAVLRRSEGRAKPVIVHGEVEYEPATGRVAVAGRPVTLSARELAIFDTLMTNRGRVISKARLEDRLYAWNEAVESNTVEVHVSHLRRKVGRDTIRTVRGLGYVVSRTP